jgi:ABC-2 type transport system permease protein
MRRIVRLVFIAWWLQLKMRSRSAFDGLLALLWPLFFATTIFLMYRQGSTDGSAMASTLVGAGVMGVWSATATASSFVLQMERRQGTLELLVAAPVAFPVLIVPLTLSMATIGGYSLLATLLWGRIVFGIPIEVAHPITFLVAILATVVAIAMLGFLIAITSVRYRSAWALGSALELPVWLVCGFLVSVSVLPPWCRPLSWILAPTWGVAAIRSTITGRDAVAQIAVCLGIAAAYGVAGHFLSRLLLRSARERATVGLS